MLSITKDIKGLIPRKRVWYLGKYYLRVPGIKLLRYFEYFLTKVQWQHHFQHSRVTKYMIQPRFMIAA